MKVALATSTTPVAIGRRSHSHPSASKLAPPLRQGRSLSHALRVAIRRCCQSGKLFEIFRFAQNDKFAFLCDVGADRCVCPFVSAVLRVVFKRALRALRATKGTKVVRVCSSSPSRELLSQL